MLNSNQQKLVSNYDYLVMENIMYNLSKLVFEFVATTSDQSYSNIAWLVAKLVVDLNSGWFAYHSNWFV